MMTGPNAADIQNMKFWMGLFQQAPTNVSTLSGGFGRRFPLCGWHRHELDGCHQRRTTQSPSPANTGVAVASNTRYKFRIRVDSGNGVVYFSVNDSTEVSLNVNLPATTQNLGYALYALTNTAAGKNYLFSRAMCSFN